MKVWRYMAAAPILLTMALGTGQSGTASAAGLGPHLGHHAISPQAIHAQPVNWMAYDIEAYNYYCLYGGTSCTNNIVYGDAEAYGPPGVRSGTPTDVFFECDTYQAKTTGAIYDYYMYVDYTDTDNVFINPMSRAAVTTSGTEQDTDAYSSMSVWASDTTSGDKAVATGFQYTDNDGDYPLLNPVTQGRDGFRVSLTGKMYLDVLSPDGHGGYNTTDMGVVSNLAHMNCIAGGSNAVVNESYYGENVAAAANPYDPYPSDYTPYAEGEFE